jgi:hypothetical protein
MPEAKKPMPKWTKAPEALVALFTRTLATIREAEGQRMFGYPAAFIRGQMFTGLFQSSMILRLSPEDRARFLEEFPATLFEPMPGRVMREYVVLPATVLNSSKLLDGWLAKSFQYASSLPPKGRRLKAAFRGRKKN